MRRRHFPGGRWPGWLGAAGCRLRRWRALTGIELNPCWASQPVPQRSPIAAGADMPGAASLAKGRVVNPLPESGSSAPIPICRLPREASCVPPMSASKGPQGAGARAPSARRSRQQPRRYRRRTGAPPLGDHCRCTRSPTPLGSRRAGLRRGQVLPRILVRQRFRKLCGTHEPEVKACHATPSSRVRAGRPISTGPTHHGSRRLGRDRARKSAG
jgi:hypothetical protein